MRKFILIGMLFFSFIQGVKAQHFVYRYDFNSGIQADSLFDISKHVNYPSGGNKDNSQFTILSNPNLDNGLITQQSQPYILGFSPKNTGGTPVIGSINIPFELQLRVSYGGIDNDISLYFTVYDISKGMGMEALNGLACYTDIDVVQFIPSTKFNTQTTIGGSYLHGLTTPLVGDLNGDGRPEIVMTGMQAADYTNANKIAIINGQTGALITSISFPAFKMQDQGNSGSTGWHPSAGRMALVDADRNGKGEIIIAWGTNNLDERHCKLVCFEVDDSDAFTFKQKWVSDVRYDAYGTDFGSNYQSSFGMQRPVIQIADLDEDGVPEIIVYNKIYNSLTGKLIAVTEDMEPTGNYLNNKPSDYENYAYVGRERISGRGKNANGTSIGNVLDGSGDIAHSYQYIYDLDFDGKMEIIAGGKIYYDVDFSRGIYNAFKVKSLYGQYGLDVGDGYTGVADIDGDGKAEVVVIMNDYNKAYNANPRPERTLRIVAYDPGFVEKSGNKWVASQKSPEILADVSTVAATLGTNQGTHSYVFIADLDGRVQNNKKFPEISIIGGTYFAGSSIPAHPNVNSISPTSGGFPTTYTPSVLAKGVLMSWTWNDDAVGINDRLKVSFVMEHNDASINTGFSLFDFDNDGIEDICYRDEQQLRILSPKVPFARLNDVSSGTTNPFGVLKFATNMGTITGYEYPVIADTDMDGSADIAVTGGAGVTFYSHLNVIQADPTKTKFTSAPKVWNQYMYHPLKINEDLTTPLVNLHPLDPVFSFITDTSNLDLKTFVYNNTVSQVVKYSLFDEKMSNGDVHLVYKTIQAGPNAKVIESSISPTNNIRVTITNIGEATLNGMARILVYDGDPEHGGGYFGAITFENLGGGVYKDLAVGDTVTLTSTFTVPRDRMFTIRVADASENVSGVWVDKFKQLYKDCDWSNNVSYVAGDLILRNDTISMLNNKIVIYPFVNDVLPFDKCDSSAVEIISGIFNGLPVNGPHLGTANIHTQSIDAVQLTDSMSYTIASPGNFLKRDSLLYEVTCWNSDRTVITKDTALILIIYSPFYAVDDYVTIFKDSEINIDVLVNDIVPGNCGTMTLKIEENPKHGSSQIESDNSIKYTTTSFSGLDTLTYSITCENFADAVFANVYIKTLNRPEIVLADSCSFNPQLKLTMQYPDLTYNWEYSEDNTTWSSVLNGSNTKLSINKTGYYRVTMYIDNNPYKITKGIKVDVKSYPVVNRIWYRSSSNIISNIW